MSSLSKVVFLTSLLASSCGLANEATAPVRAFKSSWVAEALRHQREIDLDLPLNRATFLGTHNSENAIRYQIPLIRYLDPNQILGIYDQLEMGMRSIEFDVHWYFNSHFKRDILLSHALDNHAGCSPFDRPVTEGLAEVKEWLQKNPQEVVILYFDRGKALDGHEALLAQYVEQYLGDFLYRPPQTSVCAPLPATLSKAAILAAHKQIVIVSKGCDTAKAWNAVVFAGIGAVPGHEFSLLDSSLDGDFTGFPDCSRSTTFKDDPKHTVPWRIFEDRTKISAVFGHPRDMLVTDVTTMINCGINWPTFDMLSANDDRLRAAIWSWAPDYPKAQFGRCAILTPRQGIMNVDCQSPQLGVACQNNHGEFTALTLSSTDQSAEVSCQTFLGHEWHFAMPMNGEEMYRLKKSQGLAAILLNYHADASGQHWRAN